MNISLHRAPGSRVMYALMPMDFDHEWWSQQAKHFGVNIVVVTGMDWDDDLTPWPAPGEPPGSPGFEGDAEGFLMMLEQQLVPMVEMKLKIENAQRTLCGISLSGLFAMWARTQTADFRNIISISGSFWYPGFAKWLSKAPIPRVPDGKIYISLGNEESHTNIKAFQSVAVDTDSVVDTLRRKGLDVEFRSVPGNHYAPPEPRLLLGFECIFNTPNA